MKQQIIILIKCLIKRITPIFFFIKRYRSWYRKTKFGFRTHPEIEGRIHYDDQSLVNQDFSHYHQVGNSAIINIDKALQAAALSPPDIRSLLDFPCGYGRVLRILRSHFNRARIDACDIVPRAIKFCAEEFEVETVLSGKNFSKIKFSHNYDLVWSGSLVTHLNQFDIDAFFKKVDEILNPKGLFIFTTHGESTLDRLDTYGIGKVKKETVEKTLEKSGFYYKSYPGETGYGISICRKEFILRQIDGRFTHVYFSPKGWDNHQDVYAFQKPREILG